MTGSGDTRTTVLVVIDDEPNILRALRVGLSADGYRVLTAADGASALRAAADDHPDAIVLDLELPDLDGIDLIAGIRGWSDVPILGVSARTDPRDMVAAFDAGADYYVTKPFAMVELRARLRAAVRRAATSARAADGVVVTTDTFVVDLLAKKVRRDGVDVHLTRIEWGILEVLARNPGRLVAQKHLLREVWGPDATARSGGLRVHMAQLRRKLERQPARPRHLITEPGVGYRFEP